MVGKELVGDIRHVLWLGLSSEPVLPRCSPLWCPQEQAATDAVHPQLSLCPVVPWNGACGRGEPTKPSVHPLQTWHGLAPLSGSFPEHLSRTTFWG